MTEYIVITAEDWSEIKEDDIKLDSADSENEKKMIIEALCRYASVKDNIGSMGLHIHDGRLWTAGFIGAKRFGISNGRDVVLYVSPRFSVDPYKMLDCVLDDEEYEKYESGSKQLYKFFEREQMIPSSDSDMGGELLLAVSYIKSCEAVCKKALKSQMTFFEENLNGKIKGKILFSKQIRQNVSAGRDDRVFCRYQTFSVDTQENRILKAALLKAVKIIDNSSVNARRRLPSLRKSIRYCMKLLENVKTVYLNSSQFANIKVNGMYSYYQKPIQLAKLICSKGHLSASFDDSNRCRIIPYAINMEALFEYYVRARIRGQNVYLEEYNKEHTYLKNQPSLKGVKRHLAEHFIPDIIIYERTDKGEKGQCLGVYDVKYKDHTKPDRNDSLQLMAYVLMLETDSCGFIMPLTKEEKAKGSFLPGTACGQDKDIISQLEGISVNVKGTVNTSRESLDIAFSEYLVSM